jgi:hypothetical protein
MKLDYSHFFDLISADAQVVIDCEVWWEKGTPSLVVNDVLEREGKVSLLHSTEDKFAIDCALRNVMELWAAAHPTRHGE